MMENKLDARALNQLGLNLQAVFDIVQLPAAMRRQLEHIGVENGFELNCYSQVILIGNVGGQLWSAITRSKSNGMKIESENPVDDFSVRHIKDWLSSQFRRNNFNFLYPIANYGDNSHEVEHIDLQAFGKLAGWHNDSPLNLGINQNWGTWFAYRALILVNSQFKPTPYLKTEHPCLGCNDKPCLTACPASAVTTKGLSIEKCIDYRMLEKSSCRHQCLARLACPIGPNHQYTKAQINYHYLQSYQLIKRFASK